MLLDTRIFQFSISTGSSECYLRSKTQPDTGKWYNINLVWNGTKSYAAIIINGKVDAETLNAPQNIQYTSIPLRIGYGGNFYHPDYGWLHGIIDEIRISNIARTILPPEHPFFLSIKDVPHDQGGKVTLKWNASILDTNLNTLPFYSLWRAIPNNAFAFKTQLKPSKITLNFAGPAYRKTTFNGKEYDWEWVANQPAHRFFEYSYTTSTLYDSMSTTDGKHYFLVSAHTSDPNVFYDSNVDSGYSVDNLAPIAVKSLFAQTPGGSTVKLTWDKNNFDSDLKEYIIYRSTSSGFSLDNSTWLALSCDTTFTDFSPPVSSTVYYRVSSVDIHGNEGQPSPETPAMLTIVTNQYTVNNRWNMVSIPMNLIDKTKHVVYPSSISDAFTFQGRYVTQPNLSNGVGYWLKFWGSQSVSMVGLLRTKDTITVKKGWNMIGSISEPLATSSILSNPPGITTGAFYGYNNGYFMSDSILPGKGYWVKVNQSGSLILSTSSKSLSSNSIKIILTSELPPSPPEQMSGIREIPNEFALHQNYPNPFNPTTSIQYGIPVRSHVKLEIFNTLGQKVATLAEGEKEAGYHSAVWQATVSSGLYFYRLYAVGVSTSGGETVDVSNTANDPSLRSGQVFVETRKMILLR